MKIHLSKPGGHREGPFTIEQIKSDLAARKYHDTDYWAWHEGLSDWVPLHSVPELSAEAKASEAAGDASEPVERAGGGDTVVLALEHASAQVGVACARPAPEPDPETTPPLLEQQLFSGMRFAALEQIFMLTTGDGPATSKSEVTRGMLEAATGVDLGTIRHHVPRHVITHCEFLEELRGGGPLPEVAWRAVASFNEELVQQAREGVFRICVRSFPIETGDMATLFLFYNKQRL
ncbi:MAG TPA: DUF4339 domain-containing protein [Candidatus Acidoferrum sp.]|jgi:hypothetical protein|nr:DUF4339 domain-containing protein [Candidatus Acidoferrum sp.]